ncbi:putative PhzF superfamily epimerase YddE/YHI9 [Lysinibacillus sp. RC46]
MSYYVIDAFTETKLGGNPAGVVIHATPRFAEELYLIGTLISLAY